MALRRQSPLARWRGHLSALWLSEGAADRIPHDMAMQRLQAAILSQGRHDL